ncbi:MAG: COX15/CtaA family protein [Rickettsiales bacterium]|nr:COX15/CtaA family protein [Rickettsiales bacterium]
MNGNKKIAIWLLISAFLVLAMVIVGGLTRLTESGLSIVYWKPIHGTIPPISDAEWNEEFSLYKSSPEYKIKTYSISLDEFKYIFWWEYAHRLLGRVVGLVFFLPLVYFLYRKEISFSESKKFFGIFLLGGIQGVLGWYMVQSGLIDNPNVSHFRLAAHLSMALLIFCLLLWYALTYLGFQKEKHNIHIIKLNKIVNWVLVLLFIQIIYGAFLAGLDGGLIYNTWPSMNGEFLPEYTFDKGLISVLENLSAIQFIHRWLAFAVFGAILLLLIKSKKASKKEFAPKKLRKIANIMHILVFVQIVLGIYTLLYQVPIITASAHQINSVLLLASVIYYKRLVS